MQQLLVPVAQWLSELSPPEIPNAIAERTNESGDSLIDALLVTVQTLLSLQTSPVEANEEQSPDDYIKIGCQFMSKVVTSVNLDSIVSKCSYLLRSVARQPANDVALCINRVLPFLHTYAIFAESQIDALAQWTKSLLKLDYVLCSIVLSLAKQGFCQPKEMEENGDAEEGGETMEGTGLGEGTGGENVSKEIQDESQVEGLQGESGADDDVERAEEDNAVEMANDFGGKMQDVPEGEGAEGEDDEKGSEQDFDDQLGDLDLNDEAAVDEKLWGDEQGPDDRDEKSKQSKQDNSTRPSDQQDVVAKEGDEPSTKSADKEEPSNAPESESQPEADPIEDGGGEEQGEDDYVDAGQDGAQLDDYVQNAETLDLPDDIDMGANKEQTKDEQDSDGDAMSGIEEQEDSHDAGDLPDDVEESADPDNAHENENVVPGDLAEDDPAQEGDKEVAQPDTSSGDGVGDGTAIEHKSTDREAPVSEQDQANTRSQAGSSAQGPSESEAQDT